MSLDYFYGKVKDADTVVFDENDRMRAEVQSVIFLTMPLGMSQVTEANATEFYRRFRMFYRVKGYNDKDVAETGVTLALVKSLAGLGTNASSKTMAAFKKDLMKELEYQGDEMVSREVLKLKAAGD